PSSHAKFARQKMIPNGESPKEIVIVGRGRLGTAFSRALHEAGDGERIVDRAEQVAPGSAALLLLAVPDRAIRATGERLLQALRSGRARAARSSRRRRRALAGSRSGPVRSRRPRRRRDARPAPRGADRLVAGAPATLRSARRRASSARRFPSEKNVSRRKSRW